MIFQKPNCTMTLTNKTILNVEVNTVTSIRPFQLAFIMKIFHI